MSVQRGQDFPETATVLDVFVDEFNGTSNMWRCMESYSLTTEQMASDIPDADRPSVGIGFRSLTGGNAYYSIIIVNGGTTGSATISKTGSGTRLDPHKYEFTLYDDNGSNADIATLLSGDTDIEVYSGGADATQGTPTASSYDVYNQILDNWDIVAMSVVAIMQPNQVTNLTQELPLGLPASVANELHYGLARKMMEGNSDNEQDYNKMSLFSNRFEDAKRRAHSQQNEGNTQDIGVG